MRVATVRHIPQTGVEIHSPYDANFVTELKVTVPHFARKWMPERKVWIVSDAYSTTALQLLQSYFTVVDLDEEQQRQQREQEQQEQEQQRQREHDEQQRQQRHEYTYSSSTHGSDAHAVLHLLSTAPPELIKAAFHCLAKLYHPDRGGDLAHMQKLNAAYEKLQR